MNSSTASKTKHICTLCGAYRELYCDLFGGVCKSCHDNNPEYQNRLKIDPEKNKSTPILDLYTCDLDTMLEAKEDLERYVEKEKTSKGVLTTEEFGGNLVCMLFESQLRIIKTIMRERFGSTENIV